MNSLRCISAAVFIGFSAFASIASGSEFMLFRRVWGSAVVATDTTEAGEKLTLPTPQHPVFYQGRSLGRRLGSAPGDKEPSVKEVNQVVAGILAKQGYLPAKPGAQEPDLFLLLQWGYVTPFTLGGYSCSDVDLLWFLGYNPADDIAATINPRHPGPEAWRRQMRSNLTETILEDAGTPIYAIIVTAFDPKTARTPNPVVYWQTRIGLPANGKSMAEALPVMLKAAGPAIGRPADKPVMLNVDEVRQGNVRFGEAKVIDYQTEPHGDGDAKSGKN